MSTRQTPLTSKDIIEKFEALEQENVELKKTVGTSNQMIEALRVRLKEQEQTLEEAMVYLGELDAVTFIALYLWTGKFKKVDIGAISERRITQANALRINGRRSLGEYREKQRVKDVKAAADELGIAYDDNTDIDTLSKEVSSAQAMKAAQAEQKRRDEAKEKEDASSDSNSTE